ncbi:MULTISPECIES: hypothetical protein [unclassified Exiguobacterium]|uniref:hypothetical protein n=1 Tax=unclassified Exiguobacterium TaxID=2644629 RepID=UPI00103FECBC|nr:MULTISPECIES: hypothetical protein [unclassified Exiguobacterium]TCI48166.1 hypothetical protein EVJ31_03780 [Exiguobacterium sp. SH5S32]TCI55053.1 hypothetical protein EVJ25_03775 [Exiguobacterium sp. SH1S4]TCI74845.1 hypothetical protein EVJ23_03770 [Exiguobacterium sp. SH1S1]
MAKKSFKLVKASAALAVTAAALTPVMAAEASTSTVELKAEVVLGGKFKEALALNTPKGVEIKWGKYLVTAINKWQTVKGQGSDGKTYIKKLYARNYPLYIFDQDLGEVKAGSELTKPSIRVMYRDGKVYTQAPERFTMSSTYNTKDAGAQKVLISYNHNGNRITSFLTYTVVASEVAFSNVASSVDQAKEVLSVTADVENAKEDTKADVLIYPFKDASKAIPVAATIKDGKLTAKTPALPAGTHSFVIKSGEVMTAETAFTVETTEFSVKPVKVDQLEVKFNKEVSGVEAADFKLNNGRYVTKVEVDADDKTKLLLTLNADLVDRGEYTLSVNNFSVPSGEVTTAIEKDFEFEVAAAASVTLTKTNFLDGDDIFKSLVVKDKNGVILSDAKLEVSSTSTALEDGKFEFQTNPTTGSANTFFVEVKAVDAANKVLATTGAVKVTVSSKQEIAAFDGVHISSYPGDTSADEVVEAYKEAKKDGKLDTTIKLSENDQFLDVFVKDVSGDIQVLTKANSAYTNLTPAIATVSPEGVITAHSTGTAKVKIVSGDFERIVEFSVVASSKVADATLTTTSLSFDSGTVAGNDSPKPVGVNFFDQYKGALGAVIGSDGVVKVDNSKVGTLEVKSSNTNVAEVTLENGVVSVEEQDRKGTATITITFKDNDGKVVFTKSVAVKVSEFDATVASYDLVLTSDNKYLDADVDDANVASDVDNAVSFTVKSFDKFGNVIPTPETALVTYDVAFSSESHANYFEENSAGTLSFKATAAKTFAGSGKATIKAFVNGVQVDTVAVDYSNTDSVATKAMINTTSRTIDLSDVDGLSINNLLFGKVNSEKTKFTLQPAVSVQDQFGKPMNYDLRAAVLGTLSNGAKLSPEDLVVTNKVGVDINNGVVTLVSGRPSGTFTVVVPQIVSDVNGDLLSAPVAFDVKVVQ